MKHTEADSKRRYSGDGPERLHFRRQRRNSLPGSFPCSWDGPYMNPNLSPTNFSRDKVIAQARALELQSQNRGLMQTWGSGSGQNEMAMRGHTGGQPFWDSPYNAPLQGQADSQGGASTPFDDPQTMVGMTQQLSGMDFHQSDFRMDVPFSIDSSRDGRIGNRTPMRTNSSTAFMMDAEVRSAVLDRQYFDFLDMGPFPSGTGQLGFQQRTQARAWNRRASLGSEPTPPPMGRDFHHIGVELGTHQQPVMGEQFVLDQKIPFQASRRAIEDFKLQSIVADPTHAQKTGDNVIFDEDVLSISHAFSSDDDVSVISAIEFPLSSEPNFVLPLAVPSDEGRLSGYQILLRQSLEYFSATKEDVETHVQGRKQKIRLGQIGVRCRFCAHLRIENRGKGAVYFPRTLINVYQAAQNISAAHFSCERYICPFVPITLVEDLDGGKPRKNLSKGGRTYWIDACKSVGIVENDRALWLEKTLQV